jgi:hypothetical protein
MKTKNNRIKSGAKADQKRVAYDYFYHRQNNGDLEDGWKDKFIYRREEWDALQRTLAKEGHALCHDDIKKLVIEMDKAGYLGGISLLESYDQRHRLVEVRSLNNNEFGHAEGISGIINLARFLAEKANSPLNDYYQTQGWQARSWEFRKSKNWTCELCLADHSKSKHLLHAHHRTYKLADGSCALYRETERELMALCGSPCHQMADIARMVREGKHKWQIEETMSLF